MTVFGSALKSSKNMIVFIVYFSDSVGSLFSEQVVFEFQFHMLIVVWNKMKL